MRLYDFQDSGNGYKVRLLLHKLGVRFDYVPVDILKGESRTPAFLAMNPNGRIPVLEIAAGTCLAESNAIICYLAEGTPFFPADRLARAQILQWLFFEQYSHEPNIATLRFWLKHPETGQRTQEAIEGKRRGGYAALEVMERHLQGRKFFVGDAPTVADIALYAYTHVAAEGGFDLGRFPRVREWLARVAAEPRYVPITWTGG
jgi:glutathione S-transferase